MHSKQTSYKPIKDHGVFLPEILDLPLNVSLKNQNIILLFNDQIERIISTSKVILYFLYVALIKQSHYDIAAGLNALLKFGELERY